MRIITEQSNQWLLIFFFFFFLKAEKDLVFSTKNTTFNFER